MDKSKLLALAGKRIFTIVDEKGHESEPILSVFQDLGVVPRDSSERRVVAAIKNLETFKLVTPGDFVISLRSFQGGIEQSRIRGIVSPAYTVLRNVNLEYSSDYLRWVLKADSFISILASRSDSLRDGKAIDPRDVLELEFPKPPLAVQETIASFLTHKTTQIDTLIAKKQRFLTLLEEKRQALITRAVTKGLNPDVPMKDSGIEWIGEVPKGWDVMPLKLLASLIQTGPFGSQLHADAYIENGTPVINPSHIRHGLIDPDLEQTVSEADRLRLSRHLLQEGDLIFARRGELGRSAVAHQSNLYLCGTGSMIFRPNFQLVLSEFIYLLSNQDGFRDVLGMSSVGSTMENMNPTILGSVSVPIPPIAEQRDLVRHVKVEGAKVDRLRDATNKAITTLREYRSALITNAVTGQLDLSDWKPESDSDDAIDEEISELAGEA